MNINIISYTNKNEEEKAAEYVGIIVPSIPYLTGNLSLRCFLNKQPDNLTTFSWSYNRNALMLCLINEALKEDKKCDIYIFPISQTISERYNLHSTPQENGPKKEEICSLFTKMLDTHAVINIHTVILPNQKPGLFQSNNKKSTQPENIEVVKPQL